MILLIKIGYIAASVIVGGYIYVWSSTFKKLGSSTMEEFNEGEEEEEELLSESETKMTNYIGTSVFVLLGIIIWILQGVTVGKIASDITDNNLLKWPVYFFMYFIFLRFPFGVTNKMVKRSYDFESLPEKIVFVIVMIAAYIISICCYESLPDFLKWHMSLLENNH